MGVELSGIIRKAWEKGMESQPQLNGSVNNFVIDFPEIPCIVVDLFEGGPGLERRAKNVAPISRRKLAEWPPPVRVTRSSCAVMKIGAKVGSPGPHQF